MSRTRDARNAEALRQVQARRNSPAHKALRKRSAARPVPDAVVADPPTVEQPQVATLDAVQPQAAPPVAVPLAPVPLAPEAPTVVDLEPVAQDTLVLPATEPEHVPATTPVSPYPSIASPSDPTPTEAFAIAMGATPPKRHRFRKVLLWTLAVLVVGYGAAAFLLRNTIPDGTTIGGVPAGDTVAEATETTQRLAKLAAATPVTLTAGDGSTTLNPTDAGLSVDVGATVAGAGGFTLDPVTLWNRVRGEGTDHDLVVAVNQAAFSDAVHTAATELNSTASDAQVTIIGTTAQVTDGSQAVTVDVPATQEDILAEWPTVDPIAVTAEVQDPDITTREANALAASLNAHVFACPTTLTGPNVNAVIPAAVVAGNSSISTADGSLTWEVNGVAISSFIRDTYPKAENEPTDATYKFTKTHQLKVTEGEPGRQLDVDAVDDAVVSAAKTTSRSAPIPYIETQPEVTAEDLPTQDFTKRISHFRTPLTNEPIRTKNLVRAAQLLTGTVVKAGEQFDLTKTISPITAENGYFEAHVIVDGVFTTGMGGGLSQVATTTYNAGYFAGYDDIQHRPHSVWFTRYPAGRESTIYSGQINVVFENTTPYAMIMNAYVEAGDLNVDIWSTPYYTVKTEASPKTNYVQPKVVDSTAKNCEAKGVGNAGFTITNTRWVYHDDELVEKRSWTWTYKPDNGVRCVG